MSQNELRDEAVHTRQSIRTMSHKSRPSAIRAWYQSESAGCSRLSFSKALCSAISLSHTYDHSVQLGPPIDEGTGGDSYILKAPLLSLLHPILTPPLIPGIYPHLPLLLFLSSLMLFLPTLLIFFHALPQSLSA